MPAAPRTRVTEAEYLAREELSEQKHELVDGEIFAMAGGSDRHNRIAMNLGGELRQRLRGGPCFVVHNQRHKVEATGLYTYPDVTVRCRAAGDVHTRVLVEVLSASTEAWDRGGKFAHLQQDPDVAEYVLVSQRERRVEHFARVDGGRWVLTVVTGDSALALPSLGVDLPLAEIYLGAADERSDDESDPHRLG